MKKTTTTGYRHYNGKDNKTQFCKNRVFPVVRIPHDSPIQSEFRNTDHFTDRYFTQVSAARDKAILRCYYFIERFYVAQL